MTEINQIGNEKRQNGTTASSSFSDIIWQSNLTSKALPITVNNPTVALPREGLEIIPDFLSEKESQDILQDVYSKGGDDFLWEGFDLRRKVLRFSLVDDDEKKNDGNENSCLLPTLRLLVDRIRQAADQFGENPIREVTIEEYPQNQVSQHLNIAKSIATTFETPSVCSACCSGTHTDDLTSSQVGCDCYMACLPLTVPLIEYVNRPQRREVNCFELHAPPENHDTCWVIPKSALVVKKKDFLFHWRSRIVKTASIEDGKIKITPDQKQEGCNRIVLLKFYGLTNQLAKSVVPSNPNFGYVPTQQDEKEMVRRKSSAMPKLEDLLTIIVTTSPVKSNPSTELLEKVFETFKQCGEDFAYKCRKIIVCDGCRQRDESTTKKHTNDKQSMRNGIVTMDQNKNYSAFKHNLKQLCLELHESPIPSPFNHTTVHELDVRQGYGFALRHALRECVDTPYVIVIQHDRTFMRPTPVAETVRAMWYNLNIKYVGMSMRSNLMMRDLFVGQYGGSYSDEMLECICRLPELQLDASKYGPDSESTEKVDYGEKGEKLRENLLALAETYRGSQQHLDNAEWLEASQVPSDKCQLSLTPTLFWYDNVHICETSHYRDFIFDPYYRMVVKGGFVEDKLSPVIKRTVERLGLKEGHSRFGCFLLDDHSGMFFTGHLDGGSYMTPQQKQELIDQHRVANANKKKKKKGKTKETT
mmetsp:Transcript_13003/g.36616  ORF Transcript_13003/g.36616 Transcript_13003/m.36616 type:complete len:700 (-) Transcript_13003:3171-5270(-)